MKKLREDDAFDEISINKQHFRTDDDLSLIMQVPWFILRKPKPKGAQSKKV